MKLRTVFFYTYQRTQRYMNEHKMQYKTIEEPRARTIFFAHFTHPQVVRCRPRCVSACIWPCRASVVLRHMVWTARNEVTVQRNPAFSSQRCQWFSPVIMISRDWRLPTAAYRHSARLFIDTDFHCVVKVISWLKRYYIAKLVGRRITTSCSTVALR